MRKYIVRCKCPLCDLTFIKEMPEWQHVNYEKVYKTQHNYLLAPCDVCRKSDLSKMIGKP